MKPRPFPGYRMELDVGANIRRVHAYIRSINPTYKVAGRMERKIQMARADKKAKLVRVK